MGEPPNEASPARERSRELTSQANALRAEGRWRDALPLSFEAVRADPGNAAAAHNLGVLLAKIGRLKEGEAATRHALSIAPNSPTIIHALAHALLAQGRYKEGWPLYEIRALMPELNTGFPRDFPFPRWRGEPLTGKRLVIFPEQGLGDQIQFARFLPALIEQAAAVTLLTLPPLERLFRHNFPDAEIVLADGATEFPDPDCWTTLHDLPGALGIELDTIPGDPYLRPSGAWRSLPPGFKIGLKTRGNPKHVNDKLRSLPEECAERLRTLLPGVIVSLEPDESGATDMADTAAIIDQLDLVVSVDTSVAHLAGALGKPCLLLIAGFSPDWRWMFDREDSPWYPRHKLFRSEVEGSWDGAVDRLIDDARAREAAAANPLKGDANVAALMRRAVALRDDARFPEALDLMREIQGRGPDNPGALNILGTMLRDFGELEEAEDYQRRALALAPDYPAFRYSLAVTLLTRGRFAEAWPLYEARSQVPSISIGFPKGIKAPRWRGEDLRAKRLTILPEQGFGDEIQFSRFLPRLLERGAQVRMFTRAGLVDLFASSFPDVEILPADGDVELGEPDYWTTLVDMAQPLGVALDDIPAALYLHTDRIWPSLGPGLKIGLQTSGNKLHTNDAWRSLPPEDAAALRAALPGRIVDLDPQSSGVRDFADTSALIDQLDLVVSVDTAVAHLAGALGKPCFLLLPSLGTDWRWLRNRDDSPWYPRHRLYCSDKRAHWGQAIERLGADVRDVFGGNAAAPRPAGRWAPSLTSLRKTAAAQPKSMQAQRKLAELLIKIGDLREGEAVLRSAIALGGPDVGHARYQLALCLMGQGRYREAWPLHRALTQTRSGYPKGINGPRWEGQPLAGKRLVVFAEQGMGDTLQLARFLPRLQGLGATVTMFERPALVPLLRSAFPSIAVRPAAELAAMGPQDYWTTTFDMLEWLEVDLTNLLPAAYGGFPAAPTDSAFRIGFCTRGNPTHPNDRWRSLDNKTARRLREALPGEVVDLHPEQSGATDFAATARIMAGLDLIVSVDTSVAHLAGVMDKNCLLLLPGFGTDWRWLRDRDDSPWYPRHRLFWSDVDGDWSQALDLLAAEAHRIALGDTAS